MTGGALCLLGGGEFSFGETLDADREWLERTAPGPIGFIPAASGSVDYGLHFTAYLKETFGREVEVIPIYRERDARRGRNAERIRSCPAIYIAGGVPDHLLEALAATPAHEALLEKLSDGGVVVAIAAAAQCCGAAVRGVFAGSWLDGLALAPGLAIETNFDPGHDRRLRQLMARPGVERGIGLATGSALLLGDEGAFEAVGGVFTLGSAEADLVPLAGEAAAADESGGEPASESARESAGESARGSKR